MNKAKVLLELIYITQMILVILRVGGIVMWKWYIILLPLEITFAVVLLGLLIVGICSLIN